jgi:ATP-binding cassette subfamily F protein 3
MTLLSLSGMVLQYGATPLLEDVTLTVARGERWGIIGRNGSGKTSLFRAITGEFDPERGTISRQQGLRLAVLDQHRDFAGAVTVWDAASAAFAPLLALEHSLTEQANRIGELGDRATPEMLARYSHDLERFSREGGYEVPARVSAVLHGLGFDPALAHTQPVATLSGGERGRLGLASQLVVPADLFLLDEPTNHLDLDTTAWLADHLRGLDAAALIISHDRAFLDAVADHTLHLENGTAVAYDGGYSAFVRQREERRLAQQRAFGKQAREIAAEEDFIRRNIAGQKSAQARGRRRRLMRLPRLSPPPGEEGAMAVRFQSAGRGGDQVLVAKSTLLATLLGERPADGGTVRWGDSNAVAIYRQDLAQVPRDKSLFDIIHDLRPMWTRGQVMTHLGRYDFSGDASLRTAGSLSGGELARVALAMMTLATANVLVFDEPTNHLDVESIEALEDAVEDYEGTVMFVSHDRALLRALCTRVWSLEHGHLTDYDGTFADWEAARDERRRAAEAAARSAEVTRRARERVTSARSDGGRKSQQSVLRSAQRALEQVEEAVHQLEQREATLHGELADPALYATSGAEAKAQELARELDRVRLEVASAYRRWEEVAAEVERLTADS